VLTLDLAMRLLVGLRLLERSELALGQYSTFLGDLGLERFQPLLRRRQVVPQLGSGPINCLERRGGV
jgi:hypothetical protein